MLQFQAGYILDGFKDYISKCSDDESKELTTQGLLNNLATFDLDIPSNETYEGPISPILAVANNIITRGLPTMASEMIEAVFSSALGLTEKQVENGTIKFVFSESKKQELGIRCFKALHIIEPRATDRQQYLNVGDTDSQFEKDFLLRYIPEEHSYLSQVFEHQRTRSSFTRDGKSRSSRLQPGDSLFGRTKNAK